MVKYNKFKCNMKLIISEGSDQIFYIPIIQSSINSSLGVQTVLFNFLVIARSMDNNPIHNSR